MNRMTVYFFKFSILLLSSAVLLMTPKVHATFLPEEQIRYDLLTFGSSEISEAQFREIIEAVTTKYSPIVSAAGGKLAISGDWKSEKLNAGATQMFGQWRIVISGALARRPEMTPDSFTLILCHEMGHHLGGFSFTPSDLPFIPIWAANEGQADYFSSQVCAREMWSKDLDKNASFKNAISAYTQAECDSVWSDINDRNLCYRTVAAVEAITNTMAGITGKPAPHFETPDTSVLDKTSSKHPAIQCRMDTNFQAALCPAKFDPNLIPGKKVSGGPMSLDAEKEAAAHSCMAYSGYSKGLRPTCWFKTAL